MSDLAIAARNRAALRRLRFIAWTFSGSASALLGLVLVVLFLLLAAIGPMIVPYPADAAGAIHLAQRLQPPSVVHWFGTDEMGNDIFTRVIVATRTSLEIGLIITGVATTIGVPLGIIAAYRGDGVREAIMRFFVSELRHDEMLARSLAAVNITREALDTCVPLPMTFALCASLGVYARQHPLSFKASLFLFEQFADDLLLRPIPLGFLQSRLGFPLRLLLPLPRPFCIPHTACILAGASSCQPSGRAYRGRRWAAVMTSAHPALAVPAPRPGGNTMPARTRATSRKLGLAFQSHARR